MWDRRIKFVVVDEQCVNGFVKNGRRDFSGEFIEPHVEVFDRRKTEDNRGELAGEFIVADIELIELPEILESYRKLAGEAVGVEVEDGEVREEA